MPAETRKKVQFILPHHERFPSPKLRENETMVPIRLSRTKKFKQESRRLSKLLAKEFAALRRDARFAAVHFHKKWDDLYNYSWSRPSSHHACALTRLVSQHCEKLDVYSFLKDLKVPDAGFYYAAAHRSLTKPEQVACYPTRADALRKREVVMSFGRFAMAAFPHFDAKQVQRSAEEYVAFAAPVVVHWIDNDKDAPSELSDRWAVAYSNPRGFTSCMSGFDPDNDYHPARFYALPGNGLSLAYLTANNDPDGPVTARCIVNHARGLAVRTYGDHRLAAALEQVTPYNPTALSFDAHKALDEVKCCAITDGKRLVAPYLDGIGRVEYTYGEDTCIISDNGNFDAQCTGGYAEGGNYTECDECGENYDSDDEGVYSEHHDRHLCDSCARRHYTNAIVDRHGNRDYIEDGGVVEINGKSYLNDDEVLTAAGFRYSDTDDEWYAEDDVIYLEYLGDYIPLDDCVKLDRPTEDGDEHARECDTKTIQLDGEELTVHDDYDGPEDDEDEPAIGESCDLLDDGTPPRAPTLPVEPQPETSLAYPYLAA